jgi:hypothetical protein
LTPKGVRDLMEHLLPAIDARRSHRASRVASSVAALSIALQQVRRARVHSVAETIDKTLQLLDDAVASRQRTHASTSPALNCWEILGLEQSEIQHSLVLAWLLDPRASHAQGSLFLRELLLAIPGFPLTAACGDEPYRVATEVRHTRSRIDIEVLGKTFLLHVEAKVNADEGDDQTCRERDDLKTKAKSRGIRSERAWGLYLTVRGSACGDAEKFRPVSWLTVLSAVEHARAAVQSQHPGNLHLPWILDRYSDVVRRHVLKSGSALRSSETYQ